MNPLQIIGTIISAAFILYLLFLGIGFWGVRQNHKVQGLAGKYEEKMI